VQWIHVAPPLTVRGDGRHQSPVPEIVSVETALPRHSVTSAETKRTLASYLPPTVAERYTRIVDATRIRQRFTAIPVADLLRLRTIQERNDAYVPHARVLGAEVAERALDTDGDIRDEVSTIISVSCTGYMLPSLDAHLLGALGLSPATRRLPITELGCSAGVGAVGVAAELLDARPSGCVLVLSVELSSFGVQLAEPSTTDMFANLLFSDGAAAAVVSAAVGGRGPEIVATETVLWPDSTDQLGMRLTDGGFRLVLSSHLPRLVQTRLRPVIEAFLARNSVALDDVAFWIVHPGGPKILDAVADALDLPDRALAPTWQTWEACGNLSSATVFFILKHLARTTPPPPGAMGVMMAFGPGVSCEMALLRADGWLCGA
jgi:alkylresorcinol/alkylpyrone synthase